ncbi:MAG: SDR family oxidoreductase [Thermoleophilia bacterium]|nr:SDR family oxidoreductase [Thermoleophilia bacterium]
MNIKPAVAQRLEGRVAIVTGGGGNPSIGRAISLRFVEEGAKVGILDIDLAGAKGTVAEIEAGGGVAGAHQCDVTDAAAVKAAVDSLAAAWGGRVDILVNCAAWYKGMGGFKPFDEWTEEQWDKMMAVNVRGMWNCAKAVVPYMKVRGYGKIINVTSDSFLVGVPGFIHYISSKGAVIGFTRGLAKEVGEYGIRVNALAPGYTMTEESIIQAEGRPGWDKVMRDQQALRQRNEMPEDLTGPALFLASEDSDFVTAITLVVNGGVVCY